MLWERPGEQYGAFIFFVLCANTLKRNWHRPRVTFSPSYISAMGKKWRKKNTTREKERRFKSALKALLNWSIY